MFTQADKCHQSNYARIMANENFGVSSNRKLILQKAEIGFPLHYFTVTPHMHAFLYHFQQRLKC